MNRRFADRVAPACAALFAIALAGTAAATEPTPPPPGLEFTNAEHDFGEVRQGDAVVAEFAFENRGAVPLTLSPPITGCDCSAQILGSVDLSPGEGGRVRFRCDTSRQSGPARLTATIQSSEVARRAVVLTMRGTVLLDVVAVPAEVYLGAVVRGQSRAGAFAVVAGDSRLPRTRVGSAATTGPYIDVQSGADAGRFDVRVRPAAPLGRFAQEISVSTSSERFSVLKIAVTGIVVDELPARRW